MCLRLRFRWHRHVPGTREDFDDLYHAADKALYYVKNHGRAGWKLYTPEMETE